MLYEISFTDGSAAMYSNLATEELDGMRELVEEYNKPFKLTPVDSSYRTKYCFPVTSKDWMGVYFTEYYMSDTVVPIFCWVSENASSIGHKEVLKRFTHYFRLPENLDPAYYV